MEKLSKMISMYKYLISAQVLKNKSELVGEHFAEFQKTYLSTNENVGAYLGEMDFTGKDRALSVLSSGDHAFNLIYYNILDIDTFDINRLAEYYSLGLKRAMVLKYDYKNFLTMMEYLQFFCTPEEETAIILDLLPFMDEKYRIFWKEITLFNRSIQRENGTKIRLFDLLFMNECTSYFMTSSNAYLKNEESYNKFKNLIGKANINYRCLDISNLHESYEGDYDYILLSNIMDYMYFKFGDFWEYDKLLEFEKPLLDRVRSGGVLFLNYIFNSSMREELFSASAVDRYDLRNEEIITFSKPLYKKPGIFSRRYNNLKEDGMLLVRKK